MLRLLKLSCLCLALLPEGIGGEIPEDRKKPSKPKFCQPELCAANLKHVGCTKSTSWAAQCGDKNRLIVVNGALRGKILQNINVLRNMVASGLGNLSVAARMPTMGWDKDLAALAVKLIRQCEHEGKFCSNIEKYHFVATTEVTGAINPGHGIAKQIVSKFLPSWFLDVIGCRMDRDHRILPMAEGSCVGHYIPLLQDNGDRVGCAIRTQTDSNRTMMATLLCQFSRAGVNSMPPYEVGKISGEKCSAGKSQLYKYLCNREEEVEYNLVEHVAPTNEASNSEEEEEDKEIENEGDHEPNEIEDDR